MDASALKKYYKKISASEVEIKTALDSLMSHLIFLDSNNTTIEKASIPLVKSYIASLISKKRNTLPILLALARSYYLAGNSDVYIYFTQILERDNVIENLSIHISKTAGSKISKEIFNSANLPAVGAPPDTALSFTRNLVNILESNLTVSECKKSLTVNAHGIPASSFAGEREKFLKAASLESYLKDSHNRAVQNLAEHAENGTVWFEQTITRKVVEFVKKNPEVLGGVLRDNKIYLTKIPYKPDEWLYETDPDKKRYLYCHCPMARESLNGHPSEIPSLWCNCSAGFAKQKFNAVFDRDVDALLVESVIGGSDRCRFAITVPDRYL